MTSNKYVFPTINTNDMSNLYLIRILIRKLCYITFSDNIFLCVLWIGSFFFYERLVSKKMAARKKKLWWRTDCMVAVNWWQKQKEKINEKGNNIGVRERESSIVGVSCSRDDVTQSVMTWHKAGPVYANTAQFLLPSDGGKLYPSFPVNH